MMILSGTEITLRRVSIFAKDLFNDAEINFESLSSLVAEHSLSKRKVDGSIPS